MAQLILVGARIQVPWPQFLYQFARVTKYHKVVGLNKINLLSDNFGGQSLRSRCGQSWFLLRSVRKGLFHASPLAPGGLQTTVSDTWLVESL